MKRIIIVLILIYGTVIYGQAPTDIYTPYNFYNGLSINGVRVNSVYASLDTLYFVTDSGIFKTGREIGGGSATIITENGLEYLNDTLRLKQSDVSTPILNPYYWMSDSTGFDFIQLYPGNFALSVYKRINNGGGAGITIDTSSYGRPLLHFFGSGNVSTNQTDVLMDSAGEKYLNNPILDSDSDMLIIPYGMVKTYVADHGGGLDSLEVQAQIDSSIVNYNDTVPAAVANHNALDSLQGGQAGQRWHLTTSQKNVAIDTEIAAIANLANAYGNLKNDGSGTFTYEDTKFYPLITSLLGAAGSDASLYVATAVDRIPTTTMATGTIINVIVSNVKYSFILTASTSFEGSPHVVRPNDYATGTNQKVWLALKTSSQVYNVLEWGCSNNGTFDNSGALQILINSFTGGETAYFPSGTYFMYTINVSKRGISLKGENATIKFPTYTAGFIISKDKVMIDGFRFYGTGITNTYANLYGIRITGCSNITISNCIFEYIGGPGISINNTWKTEEYTDFGSINVVNCMFDNCVTGMDFTVRAEYITVVGCSFTRCTTGVKINSGNVNLTACSFLLNTTALNIDYGVNDSHGIVSACQINHNTLGVKIDSSTNGNFFRGCNIYSNNIEISNSRGIIFDQCVIDCDWIRFDNSTGIKIQNGSFPQNAYANTNVNENWNSHPSDVLWINNTNLSGYYSPKFNKCPQMTLDTTSTTNNTPKIIHSQNIAENQSLCIKGTIKASTSTMSESCIIEFITSFKRATGGNVTEINSEILTSLSDFTALPGFIIVANTGTQTVDFTVTGENGKTIYWVLDYSYSK